jgi:type IV secretion system protein VirB8
MLIKSKKLMDDVIEHEKTLAYGDGEQANKTKELAQAQSAYLNAAKWFEANVALQHKRQARNAKMLAGFFGILSLCSVIAVMLLTPLKTVEPYVVRVDNNSGYTDIVRPLGEEKDIQQAEDEFWVATYVRARESYNFATQDSRYALVELMSYSGTFNEYRNFQLSSKGYMEVLGDSRQIRTEINNIIPMKESRKGIKTYQVRFTKIVLDRNGLPDGQILPSTWLTTVSFDYKKTPKTKKNLWLNPLGFSVHDYSPSQEVGGK